MADTSAAGGESKGVEETTGAPLGLMTQVSRRYDCSRPPFALQQACFDPPQLLKAVQEEDFDTAVRLCGQGMGFLQAVSSIDRLA